MFKKFMLCFLCLMSIFLTGCSASKQIDTAALVETVTVEYKDGKTEYTFYLLDSEEDVNKVSVLADSLQEAASLAKKRYIPNFSFSKLELFVVNKNLYESIFKKDISYISKEYYLSPLMYTAVCDDNTLRFISNTKDAPKQIEEHIMLQKKKDRDLCIDCLSIFNNYESDNITEFYIPYLNSELELKAEPYKINVEK